ncbi:MAG: hypothetical protein KAS66_02180 [Candidatus Omnitrophica bacterium]|nr:hypothetical protein [Candidatus Omnitrophota bacterium]
MMNAAQNSDTWTINYKLRYADGSEQTFPIKMNSQTLDIIQEPKDSYPEWTRLLCQKCSNCPLDEKTNEYCPIAVKMSPIVDFFCKPQASRDVDVEIETPERTYSKNVDVKTAAFSLLGIYMATGSCPIMDKLRPMARFHLPFATAIETTYRSISNYLIAQYLLSRQEKKVDWELENLKIMYEAIETVNMHFRKRLQEVSSQNYALTALLQLDSFASYISMSLSGDAFFTVESLFNKEFEKDDLLDPKKKPEDSGEKITYQYQFTFSNNEFKEFVLNLDRQSLRPVSAKKDPPPAWTELKCNKCPNCLLDEKKFKHCPAATGVSEAIEFFKEMTSTEEANILVKTAERDYSANLTATAGISAMMGLIMASSGCPILGKLKPLVRNHLPFASNKETVYRSLGMYLLSQYFTAKGGNTPDWELKDFTKLYEDINVVNKAFCNRLREPSAEDANLNALIKLDCFAQQINLTVSDGNIEDLQNLFKAYFEK